MSAGGDQTRSTFPEEAQPLRSVVLHTAALPGRPPAAPCPRRRPGTLESSAPPPPPHSLPVGRCAALRGSTRLYAGPGGAGAAPPPLGSARRSRMLRSAPAAAEGRKVWGRLRAAGAAEEKAEARFPRLIGKEG